MAFSIAKPFRKAIWTNVPFSVCVVFLLVFNALCIFLPAHNRVSTRFDLLPFTTEEDSYYSYKYWIAAGIILNSLLTYVAEKLIVNVFTKRSDARLQAKKQAAFLLKMREYRGLVKDVILAEDRDEDIKTDLYATVVSVKDPKLL